MKHAAAVVVAVVVTAALGLALLGGPAQPAGLTPAEREKLAGYLEKVQRELEAEVKDLSPAQWEFKPGEDRWSVAEVYEHIAASEGLLFELVTERVLKTPADPAKKSAITDDELVKRMVDRSQKAQAPEQLQPVNRYGSTDDTVRRFAEARKRTMAFARTTQADLRGHFFEGPFGTVDAYQLLLFLTAHSERHLLQLKEVKANPNFPK